MDLKVDQLGVIVGQGTASTTVLSDITCQFKGGGLSVLHGPSGSGKTTLISCIGLLQTPTTGEITYIGESLDQGDTVQKDYFRLTKVGFVFQESRLISALSVIENVAFPLILSGLGKAQAFDRAQSLLADLGLQGSHDKRPAQLSGGERQRVAICRALSIEPSLLLADEPTASLDWGRADEVVDMMIEYCRSSDACFLMVTHDHRVINKADHCLELTGGRLCV